MRELTELEIDQVSGGIADPTGSDPRFHQLGAWDDFLKALGGIADALGIADFFREDESQGRDEWRPYITDFDRLTYVGSNNGMDRYIQEGTGITVIDIGSNGSIDVIVAPNGLVMHVSQSVV